MKIKKLDRYITKARPRTELRVDGPCVIYVKDISDTGEIELHFTIQNFTTVHKTHNVIDNKPIIKN